MTELYRTDVFTWSSTAGADPVNLIGSDDTWEDGTDVEAPSEWGLRFRDDGQLFFTQDGDVYVMDVTPHAPKVLLADLPWAIDDPDFRPSDG